MAADVQQRMVPQTRRRVPGLDLASVYVPCFALGGDFYDFIRCRMTTSDWPSPMSAARAFPRASSWPASARFCGPQVDNVYYLYEVVRRINLMLCRDTSRANSSRSSTACSTPATPLHLLQRRPPPRPAAARRAKSSSWTGDNMVLGVNPDEAIQAVALHRESTSSPPWRRAAALHRRPDRCDELQTGNLRPNLPAESSRP
jgi:hypothetical protein